MNETNYKPCRFKCNGATKDFPFDFQVHNYKNKNELIVNLINTETQEVNLLVEGVDYTATLETVGGNVTTTTAYADIYEIVISRKTSHFQGKSFSTSGGFQASEIESAFDRVSCSLQDMDYNIETFKEEYSAETNQKIEEFRQEILDTQHGFELEINTLLEDVTEASKKINEFEEGVKTAVNSSVIATEQANLAKNKVEYLLGQNEQILTNMINEGEKQIENIKSTGFYMRDDKLYFINSKGEEEEFKGGGGSGFNLFDTKISDRILEGESAKGWALQGTYVSGALYSDFYAKCLEEYNEATNTETVNGVTVKVNSNGHKFYDIADKTSIDEFYNALGSAWFYGIDTEQERIFLPRDKYFAVKGKVDVAGNGMTLGLTDGTNNFGLIIAANIAGVIYGKPDSYGIDVGVTASGANTATNMSVGVTTDPTKSGIEGKLTANTEKYLYICVGNTIVNDSHIDVGKVLSEAVLRSSLEEVQTVIETYQNGTSWYRIWSNGLCEQGGVCVLNSSWTNNTFLKPFKDMNYSVFIQMIHGADSSYCLYAPCYAKVSNTTFQSGIQGGTASWYGNWYACGYIW